MSLQTVEYAIDCGPNGQSLYLMAVKDKIIA